jgi:hypothetical protein
MQKFEQANAMVPSVTYEDNILAHIEVIGNLLDQRVDLLVPIFRAAWEQLDRDCLSNVEKPHVQDKLVLFVEVVRSVDSDHLFVVLCLAIRHFVDESFDGRKHILVNTQGNVLVLLLVSVPVKLCTLGFVDRRNNGLFRRADLRVLKSVPKHLRKLDSVFHVSHLASVVSYVGIRAMLAEDLVNRADYMIVHYDNARENVLKHDGHNKLVPNLFSIWGWRQMYKKTSSLAIIDRW